MREIITADEFMELNENERYYYDVDWIARDKDFYVEFGSKKICVLGQLVNLVGLSLEDLNKIKENTPFGRWRWYEREWYKDNYCEVLD